MQGAGGALPTERWPDNSRGNELRGMETSWARKWPEQRSQNVESVLGEWPVVLGNLKPPPSLVNTGGTPTTQHVSHTRGCDLLQGEDTEHSHQRGETRGVQCGDQAWLVEPPPRGVTQDRLTPSHRS